MAVGTDKLGGIAVSPAIRRMLAGMDKWTPTLADIPTGDTRPVKTVAKKPVSGRFFNRHGPGSRKKEEKYLAQRRLRGLGDALLGGADLANMVINAGIADINLLTGGLGSKRDVELSMPSQDAANFLTDITGTKIIRDEEVSPEVRQEGANQRALMGLIPTGAEDVIPSGAAVQGILHGVPNLFKKPALEDLAKGVDPDKVWHDWQWELNAAGQPWTETTGKPTLNPTMERRPLIGGALPPRVSDFEPPKPVDPNQAEMFREHEMSPDLPTLTSAARVQLPMKRGPFEPRSVTGQGRQPAGTMADFVENPQLYEQPGLEFLGGLPTQWTDRSLPRNPGASGLYYPPSEYEPSAPKGKIEIRSDQPQVDDRGIIKVIDKGNPQPVATAQHELTHAAAQEFGLPQGYSWREKGAAEQGAKIRELVQGDAQKFADAFDARTADYHEYSNDLYDRTGQTISLAKFNADWAKAHPELGKILAENRDAAELLEKSDPQLAYWTSMGEVSARNAALRDVEGTSTPERIRDLRLNRPARTEDVPRRYQWTQEEEPGQIVKPSASVKDPEAPRPVGGLGSVKSKASNTEIPVSSAADPLAAPKISSVKLKTPIKEMEAEFLPFGKMREEKQLHPEWLLGKTVVPMRGDPAAAGQTLLGLGGRRFETPVDLHGGAGYPRMEENIRRGLGWASQPGAAATQANRAERLYRESGGKDVVGVYQKMGGTSTAFNTMLADTLHQMFKMDRSKIAQADIDEFDRIMREVPLDVKKKTGKADLPAYADWPGLDNLTPEYIRRGSGPKGDGKVRNKMFKLMDSKRWQDKGFPNTGYANWATTDPKLLNTPTNTSGASVVTYDPQGRTVDESGHPTYSRGIVAKEEGVLPELPLDVLYEGYRETGGTGGGPIPNQYLEKFLMTKPPSLLVDQQVVERIMKYLRTRDGAMWGLGGAVAAGIISEEQRRQIEAAQAHSTAPRQGTGTQL